MDEPLTLRVLEENLEIFEEFQPLFRSISRLCEVDDGVIICLKAMTEMWLHMTPHSHTLGREELTVMEKIRCASKDVQAFIERIFEESPIDSPSWDKKILSRLLSARDELSNFNETVDYRTTKLEQSDNHVIQRVAVPVHLESPSSTYSGDASVLQTQLTTLSRAIAESPEYATLKAELPRSSLTLRLTTEISIPPVTKIEKRKKIRKRHRRGRSPEIVE